MKKYVRLLLVVVFVATSLYDFEQILGNEFQVNTHTSLDQTNPAVAALIDGGFVICWTSDKQDGSLTGIFAQRFDETGSKAGEEFQVNTHTFSHQKNPAIATLTNGSFVICWESVGQFGAVNVIVGQLFNNVGNKIGEAFPVFKNSQNKLKNPAIASLNGGGIVVCIDGYGQIFDE